MAGPALWIPTSARELREERWRVCNFCKQRYRFDQLSAFARHVERCYRQREDEEIHPAIARKQPWMGVDDQYSIFTHPADEEQHKWMRTRGGKA